VRLPFVSRSLYDILEKLFVETVTRLERQLEDERQRTRYLIDLVADMKVSGASVVRSIATGARPVDKLEARRRSDVDQALDENKHASSNPRLRAHLAKWAEREIANGAPADKVLDRLRGWHLASSDDDDDDDNDDTVLGV
jgi:hypothetical protein